MPGMMHVEKFVAKSFAVPRSQGCLCLLAARAHDDKVIRVPLGGAELPVAHVGRGAHVLHEHVDFFRIQCTR